MMNSRICLLISSLSFLVFGILGCEDDALLGFKLDVRKLGNGLEVVLVENHNFPIISYQTWYRVGSVDEVPGITGISHLFEHLMFKGTAKYGPKEFFQQLEARGAEVNAYTSRDYTVYYENFTPSLLAKVIDMESDRMGYLTLDDAGLLTERDVVFEERKLRTENSPSGRLQEALWQTAYSVHPYRWPVIGYPQDLLKISTEDLRTYFELHYRPSNASVVVVGDFDANQAFEMISKAYGKIPKKPRPSREIPVEPIQTAERRYRIYDEVASERFAQAFHISKAADDDSYALDILSNILFGGTISRAYQKLVEHDDISTSISGSAHTPAFPGLMMITGTMKAGVPAEAAEKAIERIIRSIQEDGVTLEEVQIAVRQLSVQLIDSVRTPFGLGQLLGTVQVILGDPESYANDLKKYQQVRPGDVQAVAKKYLNPNNRSTVILSPRATSKKERLGA